MCPFPTGYISLFIHSDEDVVIVLEYSVSSHLLIILDHSPLTTRVRGSRFLPPALGDLV